MTEKHNENGQKRKSGWRSLLRAIVIILLIPVFLSFIIQIPFVQKFTVNILTERLEKKIDNDIEIRKVYLNPFKGLEIESSRISNQENGDTLLSVNKIYISLTKNLFTLFNNELALNEIEIDGVYFDIIKEEGSTKNSFTILLEKLTTTDEEKKERGKPINLGVKKIHLNNIGYTVLDENSGSSAKYMLDEGIVEFNSMDLSSGYIDIENFVTRRPFIEIIKMGEGLKDTSRVEVSVQGEKIQEIADTVENNSMLVIRHFDMLDGTLIYKDFTSDGLNKHPNSLNTRNFQLSEIALSADSFLYDPSWEIKADLKTISFKDDKGFHLKKISSENLVLSEEEITLPSMELITERSNLSCDFAFLMDGLGDFGDFSRQVYIRSDISRGQIAISDLIHFVGDLNNSDFFAYNSGKIISIAGNYRGVVDNLSGRNVDIRFGDNLVYNGNFGTIDLTDGDNALVNIKFNRLNTSVAYLRNIIPGFNPPVNFSKLGNINFVGRFDGYFRDFVAAGKISTDLGNGSLDMNLDVKDGNEKARYSGEIRLDDFKLGAWSGNEKFGLVSFYSKVEEAEGLTLNTLYADLEANVESLIYNDYTYQDFIMDGEVKENEFKGHFNIEDENINLAFNGDVSYKDSLLQLNLDADIKQLNLKELNFTDHKRNIAGSIKANMKGTGIENLIGQINSRNISIETDSLSHRIDTLSVYAFNVPGQKSKLDVFSDFGAAKIDGTYNLRDVVPQIKSILKKNYPYHTRDWTIEEKEYAENKFVINLRIDDTKDILKLAGIDDLKVKNLRAKGNVDSSRDNFNLDTDIEFLSYNDYEFHDADLILGNRNDIGFAVINIDSSVVAGRSIKPLFIETDLHQDTISFELNTKDVFDSLQVVDIQGSLSPHRRGYVLNVKDNEWEMLGEKWNFYSGNELIIGKKYLDIRDLVISDGYREIEIQDINKNGISLALKRFNFLIINGIIDYDKIDFSGEGDLRVRVENIFEGDTYFQANAYIDDFRLNGERYGVLDVSFDKAPDKSYEALLSIAKEEQTVKANFVFDAESNQVNGSVRGRSFPLDIFEYIIQNGISETKGVADVDAEIFGPPDDLKIAGEALFKDGGVKIDYLGTSFFFDQQKMKIDEKFLDLTGGILTDIEGNPGVMTGGLRHDLFRDFRLDVSMAAENAVIINTTKVENPIYYGYGKGKVDVSFKGSFDATDMKIKATTAEGTRLNIPVDYTTTGYDQSFIKFVNKEELLAPRSEKEVDEFKIEGLNVEMELSMTEDADVKIIFNEQLGDVIQGTGRGFMQIYARRTGEFEIFGDYEVEAGEYLFTAWGVVAKPFIVREGGRIKWTGDPINATLDIKADYQVRAPLSLFLDEFLQTATNDVQIEARTKQDINLQLLLGGTLYSPNVKFDLNFPNLQGEMKTYADSKLRGLRTNEIALNSQVLGLIVFNSFLPTVNSSELNYSDEAVVTAANTLSEFVSSQLSIYLTGLLQEALTDNSLIADIDFEIGMRKNSTLYAPEAETDLLPDEIEVHVTNQFRFLDQRLSLGVGANYIADSPFGVSNYYVPDFVIEYYLTNDRQLKLRMYGRYDYDQVVIARRQRYGLGIGYRKEFGSLTDFIDDVKKTAESIAEKEESQQRRQ